jgi:hypothetical protein
MKGGEGKATAMIKNDYTFSKKHLGLLMTTVGIVGLLAIFSIDIIDAGREGGIGPAQRLALELLLVLTLFGLTLIPLGDDPA